MDPISNVDRLVIILRQRLQERSKAGAAARGARESATGESRSAGLANVVAMAGANAVDDAQLGRALIESILADQFGAGMLNEPRFQQVVDRVAIALEDSPGGSALLTRMIEEVRAAAG